MAAGFPVKADYATGDVLSAANMNDLSGTLNYINPTGVTNGHVLTRNSSATGGLEWAAAGGAAGGFTLLSTTSASGNSVTVSSINQTYKHLFFEIYGITNSSSNGSLYIAPNSADNLNATCVFISSSSVTTNGDNATSNISRADLNGSSSDNYFAGWVYGYALTSTSKQMTVNGTFRNSANNLASIQFNGGVRDTNAVTALRFMIGNSFSQPFTAGTIKVYGVN